jgi:hypothetical protein
VRAHDLTLHSVEQSAGKFIASYDDRRRDTKSGRFSDHYATQNAETVSQSYIYVFASSVLRTFTKQSLHAA